MDFNLSSICDMLGDRIEEYKTTSKKRRIERGSCAPKAKIAKFTHENQTESSVKKHGTRIYASTPIETPKTESQQFSTLAMYSSINKLPGTARSLSRNLNLEAKKSPFEVEDNNEVGEKSKVENSELSFSSATKTLKRRRVQRTRLNAKRLLFDDDDQNNDECLSKEAHIEPNMYNKCLPQNSAKVNPNMGDKCLFQDSPNNVECKSIECLSKDSTSDTLTKVLSPLYTPKRPRMPRKSMIARRLTFDDSENEDTSTSVYYSLSNERSSEKTLGQIKSPLEITKISYKDQDLAESLPNNCDTTLIPDSEEMDYSTILVLNVGILIRPIRDVCRD
ncbi:uncharacterized protein LOC123870768 [Maniola jurtina]|uniref:uncharacterized protein LOC123870768 n=1 Tax=Maniola jurtina TaxID=191418 RepID=UPI001E688E60|nr:uncharacterized protein LOC123870768 [Maniola jurtina]